MFAIDNHTLLPINLEGNGMKWEGVIVLLITWTGSAFSPLLAPASNFFTKYAL